MPTSALLEEPQEKEFETHLVLSEPGKNVALTVTSDKSLEATKDYWDYSHPEFWLQEQPTSTLKRVKIAELETKIETLIPKIKKLQTSLIKEEKDKEWEMLVFGKKK